MRHILAGLLFSAYFTILPGEAIAQVLLNTGYDHDVGTTYPAVGGVSSVQDKFWIKIASYEPNSASAPVDEAFVVQQSGSWWPAASNSQWIGPRAVVNSAGGVGGDFKGYRIFRKCFCLINAVGNHHIRFDVRADDNVQVWMNSVLNTLVGPQDGQFRYNDATPISVDVSGEGILQPGRNCLYVLVEDYGGGVAFNLVGEVSGALATPARGPDMEFGPCCNEVNGGNAQSASAPQPQISEGSQLEKGSSFPQENSTELGPVDKSL
ncbi:MAG: hypothetical protein KDD92_19565, partial [Caldilineaceae bacterium]|nr:hypothetical protein [Caldilineaceae bacterium]